MKGNWLINVTTESSFENEIILNNIIKLHSAANKQINFCNLYSYSPINGTCYRLLCNPLSLYFLSQAQLHIIEADHTFSNRFLLALVHQSIALRAVTIYRPETQTNKLKLIFSEFLTFVWLLSLKWGKWQKSDKNCKSVTLTSFAGYATETHPPPPFSATPDT